MKNFLIALTLFFIIFPAKNTFAHDHDFRISGGYSILPSGSYPLPASDGHEYTVETNSFLGFNISAEYLFNSYFSTGIDYNVYVISDAEVEEEDLPGTNTINVVELFFQGTIPFTHGFSAAFRFGLGGALLHLKNDRVVSGYQDSKNAGGIAVFISVIPSYNFTDSLAGFFKIRGYRSWTIFDLQPGDVIDLTLGAAWSF